MINEKYREINYEIQFTAWCFPLFYTEWLSSKREKKLVAIGKMFSLLFATLNSIFGYLLFVHATERSIYKIKKKKKK